MLKHIGAQKIDGKGAQVLWINLREEPVCALTTMHIFFGPRLFISRILGYTPPQ